MRGDSFVEKRRYKRLDLSLPARIRRVSKDGKEEIQDVTTINVSFKGAYVMEIGLKGIKPEDKLSISISVPRDEARDFPFSRLIGKTRVVRVEKDGVALEFNEDINRFFVASD